MSESPSRATASPPAPGPPRPRSGRARFDHLVKETHTYLGLLVFSHLIVFGLAGLVATFSPPRHGPPPTTSVREVPFTVPAGASDKAVADAAYEALALPLTGPIPEWALGRGDAGELVLNFYTVNGPFRVTVLEEAGALRVETRRNSVWRYLSNLHATLRVHDRSGDWRLALWTSYVELALWSFLLMALSGIYMWLSARPSRGAVLTLAAGVAVFVVLYMLTR